MRALLALIILVICTSVNAAAERRAPSHDMVAERFFETIAHVYTTSRSCDLKSGFADFKEITDNIRSYLSNYYEGTIPFWVLPRDQDIRKTSNCWKDIDLALTHYRLARADFEEYFPEAPMPPSLKPPKFRDFNRRPGRTFRIAE
jgi:hypothetical protein